MDNKNDSPIPTGFLELDHALGGGLPRGVVTILTSPSTAEGKTSLAVSILRHVAQQPTLRSMIFSLEGTRNAITRKLLAMETGIDTKDMQRGTIATEEYRRLEDTSQAIKEWKVWINDKYLTSFAMMREHMVNIFGDNYPDFIVIDYLDLIGLVGYHAKLTELRLFARDSHAALLVVGHTIKERLTREIMMQHASALLVLDREDKSREARLDVWQKEINSSIPLYFYPPTTRFFNSEAECLQTYHHAL